jgi:Ni/Fe-hydrogenase subunit HybB-like protein
LLSVFIVLVGYLVFIENAHRYYLAESRTAESYFLFGGFHSVLFWVGMVFLGAIVPATILFRRKSGNSIPWLAASAVMVVLGVLCERFLIVIPGLSHAPDLIPGWRITRSVVDEGIASYCPTWYELLQALGVVAFMGVAFIWGLRLLKLLPTEGGLR